MFASIASSYPREPLPAQPDRVGEADRQLAAGSIDETAHAAVIDEFVREVVQEQEEAGLGVLTDGGVRWTDPFIPLIAGLEGLTAGPVVDSFEPGIHVTRPDIAGDIAWRRPIYAAAWSFAAAQTELPVKQVVPGPHTLGRIAGLDGRSRESVTMAFAEAMNAELIALVEAGCLIIQVDESGAATIEDDAERVLFSDAQRRLLDGLENPQLVHLSLAVLGGSAATAGAATMFEAPYSSYLFDLVRGPGNWQLVLQAPFDRGIVCGVETSQTSGLEDVETLVYAIAFAATSMERSMARVGVAPNGSLASISRHAARRKAERLAYAIGIAGAGPGPDVAA
ncbi:MAG TPA: hypothetical protein VNF73_04700, partial [Candidatus Saccharimonadales bacterium]|nr:hypothetical protein [Candidatus Saccharimonadales bacterium]